MSRWLLLPLAICALGAAPSSGPSTGITVGTAFERPVIERVTASFRDADLDGVLEAGETGTLVVRVYHTGHLGTMKLAVRCGDRVVAPEYAGTSDVTRGEAEAPHVSKYTTNLCTRDMWQSAGAKTGQVDIYPGNATVVRECDCIEGCGYEYVAECMDGNDNDSDTLVDMADPECSFPMDNSEALGGGGGGCGLGFELAFLLPLLWWRRARYSR